MKQAKSIAVWCSSSTGIDEQLNEKLKKKFKEKLDENLKEKVKEKLKERLNKKLNDKMQLHVNYWHFSYEKRGWLNKQLQKAKRLISDSKGTAQIGKYTPDFLDIGLMVPLVAGLDSVSIYLPFNIKLNDIDDISPLLNDKAIAGAIFNENLTSKGDVNGKDHQFTLLQNEKEFCALKSFAINNKENVISDAERIECNEIETKEGSILKIKKKAFEGFNYSSSESEKLLYFRLRVPLQGENKQAFVRDIDPEDKLLNSSYEKTEFIDFRINEFRLLPSLVQDQIEEELGVSHLQMQRIDFLLAVNLVADITGARKEFHKSRFLEPLLWENYFKGKHSYVSELIKKGILVYHWKKIRTDGQPFNDFVAFVKLKVRVSSMSIIARCTFFAFLVGLLGSLTGSFLYSGPEGLNGAFQKWEVALFGNDKKIVDSQATGSVTHDNPDGGSN